MRLRLVAAILLSASLCRGGTGRSAARSKPVPGGPALSAPRLPIALSAPEAAVFPAVKPRPLPAAAVAMPVPLMPPAALPSAVSAAPPGGDPSRTADIPQARDQAESAALAPSQARAIFEGDAFRGGAAQDEAGLRLDGLQLQGGAWRLGGLKLERLGQGEHGFVDAHPLIPGAVIKTAALSPEHILADEQARAAADAEESSARTLARAGVGPRYIGRAVRAGVQVSVRERIYGETVESMIAHSRFREEDRALVWDMLRRLVEAGVKVSDMRMPNIMIGHTESDPDRRAYIVDGGRPEAFPAAAAVDQRFESLLDQDTVLSTRFEPHVGWIVRSRPFDQVLREGVARSERRPVWQRMRDAVRAMFSSSSSAPAR